jgi:hypothetical protein
MKYPDSTAMYQGKSQRERDIEQRLKWETDDRKRRRLKGDLDDLRRGRRQDNAWSTRMAAGASREKAEEERHLRARSGSRFNIRYQGQLPPDAATPASIMLALRDYVDFPDSETNSAGERQVDARPESSAPGGGTVTAVRKGMTLSQVERLLGPARSAKTEQDGSLEVMIRVYETEGNRIEASFVGGVLIKYTITAA